MRLKNQITSRWDIFYRYRKEVRKQFPDFWKLRIIKKPLDTLREEIKTDKNILDIGAGDRKIGEKIRSALPVKNYKSMDVDRSQFHDYYSLDEIKEVFDAVFLFEVIEHLPLSEGIDLIKKIHALLSPSGKLFLTTPNIFHPNRFWRDSDHKTPYPYDELGGILLASGFSLKNIYRIYNDAFHRRVFRIYCASFLHRYLDIDFAPSILIVAQKKV